MYITIELKINYLNYKKDDLKKIKIKKEKDKIILII